MIVVGGKIDEKNGKKREDWRNKIENRLEWIRIKRKGECKRIGKIFKKNKKERKGNRKRGKKKKIWNRVNNENLVILIFKEKGKGIRVRN